MEQTQVMAAVVPRLFVPPGPDPGDRTRENKPPQTAKKVKHNGKYALKLRTSF
jgi:hypothetical protein